MEAQKQISPVETGIRYGLLLAAASVLIDFLTRIAGMSVLIYSVVAGSVAIVLMIVAIVLAHKAFRQANAGLMTYGQGVLIAVIMLLISGFITSLFNYVYVNYIDPEFVERMKDGMVAFMERNRVSDEQIAKSTEQFNEMKPPLGKAMLNGVRNGLIGGMVFGLIISAFTKRKSADFA